MQSFLSIVRFYWSIEINGTVRVRADHTPHIDHTLASFKKRGQLKRLQITERACIAARRRLHSPSRRRDHWGCPASRRRDTTTEAGHSSRRHAAAAPQHIVILYFIATCRAPKASSA